MTDYSSHYQRFCIRLTWLRWLAVTGQFVALQFAGRVLELDMPWSALACLLLAVVVINTTLVFRLRQPIAVSSHEAFGHLLLDIILLTAFLYWSGGASNPFVSLYLLPIALAASALPVGHVMGLVVLSTTGYGILFGFADSTPHIHGIHGGEFNLHLLGMWVNFVVTALVITGFVSTLANTIRERDKALADARESALRQRQVTRLGALAAGAAHELGTPLSTMSMLVSELKSVDKSEQQAGDLSLLDEQITICQGHLQRLLSGNKDGDDLTLSDWLSQVKSQFRAVRPEIEFSVSPPDKIERETRIPAVVEQAIMVVLNNAADASLKAGEQSVSLLVLQQKDRLIMQVKDRGDESISLERALSGSDKPSGYGVGLRVAMSGLETVGAQLRFIPQADSGSCVEIEYRDLGNDLTREVAQ